MVGRGTRPAPDQRIGIGVGAGIFAEDGGLRAGRGKLSLRLKGELERRLRPVAGRDRHIAEGDGILVDGGGAAFGAAIMSVFDLRRGSVDADDLEVNRRVALLEIALPVAEQIALVIEPFVDGADPAGACRSD